MGLRLQLGIRRRQGAQQGKAAPTHAAACPAGVHVGWPWRCRLLPAGDDAACTALVLQIFDGEKHWWGMRMVQLGYKVLYMDSDNVVAGNPLSYFNTTWDVQGLADNRGKMQLPTGMWLGGGQQTGTAGVHMCAGQGCACREPCI